MVSIHACRFWLQCNFCFSFFLLACIRCVSLCCNNASLQSAMTPSVHLNQYISISNDTISISPSDPPAKLTINDTISVYLSRIRKSAMIPSVYLSRIRRLNSSRLNCQAIGRVYFSRPEEESPPSHTYITLSHSSFFSHLH